MLQTVREFLKKVSRRPIVLAAFLFVLINVTVRISYPHWHPDRFSSPNRSWAWWAVKDFQKLDRTPDVLLLGSSLMVSVVHDGDATYLERPFDAVNHHRSYYLEHLLKDKSQRDVSTFSMAIGGQMASDAYAIVTTLFTGKEKPKVIVYGIAPRDFIDSMLIDPSSTETYRLMTRAGNPGLTALAGHNSVWNRTDSALQNALFLYDKKLDFVEIAQRAGRGLVAIALNMPDQEKAITPPTLKAITKSSMPEDASPNEYLAYPYDPKNFPFRDNLPEYRHRYSLFKPKVYQTQLVFLDRFLSYCRDQGIEVVMVNMPLTPENLQILPNGLYSRYSQDVSKLARQYQAQLVDFNQPGLFPHSEFADSVHVNGYGAERFLNLLSDRLSKDTQIAAGVSSRLR